MKKGITLSYTVFALFALMLSQTASGVEITRLQTGLFYDTFENATPNANPSTPLFGTSWSVTESPSTGVDVINSTAAPDPGAAEGENYLRITRSGGADNGARGDFTQVTGGRLRVEFMAYVPSASSDSALRVIVTDDAADIVGWPNHRVAIMTRYDAGTYGNYLRYWSGSSWDPLQGADGQSQNGAIAFQADTWQKWVIEVDLDAQQFVLKLGGQTSYARAFGNAGNTARAVCFSAAASVKTSYIDDVSVQEESGFFDDLESASSASPYTFAEQQASAPLQTDSDPDAAGAGSWTVQESPSYEIQVTSSTTAPDPGPYEGDNYLRLVRVTGGADPVARGDFAQVVGGTLHAEFMAYIPEDSKHTGLKVVLTDNDTIGGWGDDMRLALLTFYDATNGNHLRRWGGTAWENDVQGATGTGPNGRIAFATDTWQQWQIDMDLTAGTFTVSIDSQESYSRAFADATEPSVKAIVLAVGGEPKSFYADRIVVGDAALAVGDTTLFSDDFSANADTSPYTYDQQTATPGLQTDSDPNNWTISTESPTYAIQVTTSSYPPDPGPFDNGKYLRLHRATADVSARADFTPVTSGQILVEYMAYIPSTDMNGFKVVMTDGPDVHGWTDHRAAILSDSGGFLRYWTGSSWTSLQGADGQGTGGALLFETDTWQKWEIQVDLDSGKFLVRLGGQTSYLRDFGNAGNSVRALCFVPAANNRTFYVDGFGVAGMDVTWIYGADHPTYRKGGAVGVFEDAIISAAGVEYPWNEANSVFLYTPQTDTWQQLADMPTLGRAYTRGVTVGDAFYVVGGRVTNGGSQTTNEVWKLARNGPTLQWTQEPSMIDDRGFDFAIGAIGAKIIVAGGNAFAPGEAHYTETSTMTQAEWYDTTGGTWQALPPIPGPARMSVFGAAIGNKFYIFGGAHFTIDGDTRTNHRLADAYVFDADTNSWSAIASMPFTLSGAAAIAYDNRYIIIFAGYSEDSSLHTESGYYNATVLAYDTQSNSYQELPTPLLKGTHNIEAALLGESIYAIGGENVDPGTANTVKFLQIGDLAHVPRCGDENHPFPEGDIDGDCHVTVTDFALLAGDWLETSWP